MYVADWISAVVPAGGRGVRMGSNVPKQFLALGDVPLLVHALQTFESCSIISEKDFPDAVWITLVISPNLEL